MVDETLINRVAQVYAGESIRHRQLKSISMAQWILESGRGTSDLARQHLNFGGLKWRPEMAMFATRVVHEAHDGRDAYCKFATIENFIAGYWAFINRAPYSGWESHVDTGGEFIDFIGPIYTPSAGYAAKVRALEPEAIRMLDAATGAGPSTSTTGARKLGTIILDPGHGGVAKVGGSSPNNAISVSGVKEKKLTLDFCMILRDALTDQAKAAGEQIKVVMTRTSDVNVGIGERAALAGKHKAKALLCIHFNGAADKKVRGAETYFAAAENGNTNLAADKAFAGAVQSAWMKGLKAIDPAAKDRGLKPDTQCTHGVLGLLKDHALGNGNRTDKCVAAYMEAEFITNPNVDKLLISGADAVANRTKVLGTLAAEIRKQMAALPG